MQSIANNIINKDLEAKTTQSQGKIFDITNQEDALLSENQKPAVLTDESSEDKKKHQILRPARKGFIETLMVHVENNLSNPNLTLKFISENVLYMNTDYVSKQFIKETGIRFSVYICQLRIEKAKVLLPLYGRNQIHAVADAIGCGNTPQYFSRIFKKNTGMTPTEFIIRHRLNR